MTDYENNLSKVYNYICSEMLTEYGLAAISVVCINFICFAILGLFIKILFDTIFMDFIHNWIELLIILNTFVILGFTFITIKLFLDALENKLISLKEKLAKQNELINDFEKEKYD